MKLKTKVVCALIFLSTSVFAQSEDGLGAWYIYNGSFFTKPNIELFFETQFRYRELASNKEEIFFRPIFLYHFNATTNLGLGYSYHMNFNDGSISDNSRRSYENRIILQFGLNTPISRAVVQHRFRLEQRWITDDLTNETDSKERFRYRLLTRIPLGHTAIEKNVFFLSFYDEIFIDLTGGLSFDQNRLYGGVGYQFLPLTSFQIGYLYQSRSSSNHQRLQFWILHRLNFYED